MVPAMVVGDISIQKYRAEREREREMASLLPVLVYFEGTVQLRNIHILAGVSRLAKKGLSREMVSRR